MDVLSDLLQKFTFTSTERFHRYMQIDRWTLDVGRWTLDVGSWTLDTRRWTLDIRR